MSNTREAIFDKNGSELFLGVKKEWKYTFT
jgi:hypothetical protein